jgi:uncharacterized damage-inducible protein DinB
MSVPFHPLRETSYFCHCILTTLDLIMACLEGLNEDQLNWRPPTDGANSVHGIAAHILGSVEENIFKVLLGDLTLERQREQEFSTHVLSAELLQERWQILRERLRIAILALSLDDLEHSYQDPRRGSIAGREILLVVALHAADHLGQIELTRDMARSLQK